SIGLHRLDLRQGGVADRLERLRQSVEQIALVGLPLPSAIIRRARVCARRHREETDAGQNAGSTAPWYFCSMKAFTSGPVSAAASFCTRASSLLSARDTRKFTYGDSLLSITSASWVGLSPASSA